MHQNEASLQLNITEMKEKTRVNSLTVQIPIIKHKIKILTIELSISTMKSVY